jgi:NAD(P)-dependent dehydrogenase (short-subunit alcohol dehydrogenase family)
MKLTGKKALITGGNSGIGLATARLFVAEGAEIAITGRDQKTLDEAVAELGPNARGYRADVTVADDRKRLFADLAKDFGNGHRLRQCRNQRQDADRRYGRSSV